MRIHVVNPNMSAAMTCSIEAAARRAAAPGTEIVVTGSGTALAGLAIAAQ